MYLSKTVKAVTFRAALKDIGNNSENLISRMYKQDFLTMLYA